MTEPPEPFAALLERVRRGDEDALRELIRQYEGPIRRAARGLLGPALRPHLDSLDVVQSVHRSLWRGLRAQKFDLVDADQLIALVLTLVRRKVARHWRKVRRQQGESATGAPLRPHPPQPDPAADAEYNDAVAHLLSQLEDDLDRRLVERRLQGYSTSDVAREMNLDPRFLRVRLGRLRQRLRDRGLLSEWL